MLYDVHRYQCFERADLDMDIHGHLHKAGVLWTDEADEIQRELGVPAIAGEWSLGWTSKSCRSGRPGPTTTRSSAWTVSSTTWRCAAYGGGPAARLRALPGLVLLELPHRDHAGLVLPRVRRAGLAAVALSAEARVSARQDFFSRTRFSTILRSCSGSSPAWKLIVSTAVSGSSRWSISRISRSPFGSKASVASSMKIHAGPLQQHAREAEPLLGAQRQHLLPVVRLVEARGEPRDAGALERVADRVVAERVGRARIAQRLRAACLPAGTGAGA